MTSILRPWARGVLAALSLFASAPATLAQTSAQKAAVQLSAVVSTSPASITLSWTSLASTTSITIYKKLSDATSWGSAIATPSASSLSYTDAAITTGDGELRWCIRDSAHIRHLLAEAGNRERAERHEPATRLS